MKDEKGYLSSVKNFITTIFQTENSIHGDPQQITWITLLAFKLNLFSSTKDTEDITHNEDRKCAYLKDLLLHTCNEFGKREKKKHD